MRQRRTCRACGERHALPEWGAGRCVRCLVVVSLRRLGAVGATKEAKPAPRRRQKTLAPLEQYRRDQGERPRKGNHVLEAGKIARIHDLAASGASLREIAATVGVSKCTVMAYVGPRSHSAGIARMHQRLKAAGRILLPPWQRKAMASSSAEP